MEDTVLPQAPEPPQAPPKKRRGRPRKTPETVAAAQDEAEGALVYENCAELYKLIETDADVPYHVGVHRAAPFDFVTILGISFEFQISHWDPELRTNNFQEGRIIEIPHRLAKEIEKKARSTFYWVKVVYGMSGDTRGYVKQGEVDISDLVSAKRVKNRPNSRDPKTGKISHEYRCLWDWLILRKCGANSEMRPNESLLAENKDQQRQIEALRRQLREVT